MKTDDKIVRLRGHLEAADTLRGLLEHPAYYGFFTAYEADIMRKMRDAIIEDDASRRAAAVELSILNKFRMHLADVATRGDRARKELERLEAKSNV
jgi:hypothetical protein